MYRAVALWALRPVSRLDDMHRWNNSHATPGSNFPPRRKPYLLNGEDVTEAIREPDSIRTAASRVAADSGVRRAMVAKQREIGEPASVVMEGRDIGTVVFPRRGRQDLPGCRARGARPAGAAGELRAKGDRRHRKRRWRQQMAERDQRDSTRAEAPLAQAPDAVYLWIPPA